jgi:hypothetical protein
MKIKIWKAILSDGEARGESECRIFPSELSLRHALDIDANGYSQTYLGGKGMPVKIESEVLETDSFLLASYPNFQIDIDKLS